MQEFGRQFRPLLRLPKGRGDAEQLRIRQADDQRQGVGVVDVVPDVGIEQDLFGRRGVGSCAATGRAKGSVSSPIRTASGAIPNGLFTEISYSWAALAASAPCISISGLPSCSTQRPHGPPPSLAPSSTVEPSMRRIGW